MINDMQPKEKAKELVNMFYMNAIVDDNYSILFEDAIRFALICVFEIIGTVEHEGVRYWEEVKEEINKLS